MEKNRRNSASLERFRASSWIPSTELQVLRKGLVELLEVVLVLSNLLEQVHTLLDNVLSDNLKNLVLLERLTRDVERQVFGVNDAFDEVKVFRDEVLAIIHDKDATNVELDVVALLLSLEEIERSTTHELVSVWRAGLHVMLTAWECKG